MGNWRGERAFAELCREHDVSESLLRRWREQALQAGLDASRPASSAWGRAAAADR